MKNFRKLIVIALMLVMLISLASACASKNMLLPQDQGKSESGWDYGDGMDAPGAPEERPPDAPATDVERKFIQNGNLALRSSDVDKTYQSLVSLTERMGGRVVAYERRVDDDYGWIQLQVAVPFGKLSEFMDVSAEHVTKVETKTVTSEEVTEAYYDTKTRLESTEALIDHYRSMLTKAETIEDTLLVQSRIDELTVELESLKGYLKRLDSLTAESRIDITIRLESDPTITKPEVTWKTLKWSDVGYLMQNAIQKVGIGLVLGFQYFLVIFVYLLPLIVLTAIIVLIIWLCRKRKKRKAKRSNAQPAVAIPSERHVHRDEVQPGGE